MSGSDKKQDEILSLIKNMNLDIAKLKLDVSIILTRIDLLDKSNPVPSTTKRSIKEADKTDKEKAHTNETSSDQGDTGSTTKKSTVGNNMIFFRSVIFGENYNNLRNTEPYASLMQEVLKEYKSKKPENTIDWYKDIGDKVWKKISSSSNKKEMIAAIAEIKNKYKESVGDSNGQLDNDDSNE